MHANYPVSAIVAKAKLCSLKRVSVEEAINLADDLMMTVEDVEKYVGDSKLIGFLKFSDVDFAENLAKSDILRNEFDYNPPQSFCFLSDTESKIIDRICGF